MYNFNTAGTMIIMLITQAADFAWRNKFIDTYPMYKLINTYLQVFHFSVSDLKMKAN